MSADMHECKLAYRQANLQACKLTGMPAKLHQQGYLGKFGVILQKQLKGLYHWGHVGPFDVEKTRSEHLMTQSLFKIIFDSAGSVIRLKGCKIF
jgi:hypothetical protein